MKASFVASGAIMIGLTYAQVFNPLPNSPTPPVGAIPLPAFVTNNSV